MEAAPSPVVLAGRTEGIGRGFGETIDQIEQVAGRLGSLFGRLDEGIRGLAAQHVKVDPEFSSPWIKTAYNEWRRLQAEAAGRAGTAGAGDRERRVG